jgi:hypothetical protein
MRCRNYPFYRKSSVAINLWVAARHSRFGIKKKIAYFSFLIERTGGNPGRLILIKHLMVKLKSNG